MRFWKPRTVEGSPKVGIAVAAYLTNEDSREAAALRTLVASFQAQTYRNWELLIVHDGPYPHHYGMLEYFSQWDREPRVRTMETEKRLQDFGHHHRQAAITALLKDKCEWIGLTNQDNYYAPVYLEWLLSDAQRKKATFVYCNAVHSHKQWKPMTTDIRRGKIDLGCFLAHRSIVERIKFDKVNFAADWDFIQRLVVAAKTRVARVDATLFTHN